MTGAEAEFRDQVCAAFGLEPWQIGIGKPPLSVRLRSPLRWSFWAYRVRRLLWRVRQAMLCAECRTGYCWHDGWCRSKRPCTCRGEE